MGHTPLPRGADHQSHWLSIVNQTFFPQVRRSHPAYTRLSLVCLTKVDRIRPFSFFDAFRYSRAVTLVTARRCLIVNSLTAPPLQLLRLPKRTELANQFV